MNRRDLIFLIGFIICGLLFYYVIPVPETYTLGVIHIFKMVVSIFVYMVLVIVLGYIFPKFGNWGDKKLF